MKKTLKSGLSLLICITMVLSITLASPLRAFASGATQRLHLCIEGSISELFSNNVSFDQGESLDKILSNALGSRIVFQESKYGEYIYSIDSDTQPKDNSKYWSLYVNDVSSDVGVSSVYPNADDDIVLSFGDFNQYYPYLTSDNKYPAPGDTVKFTLSADMPQYDKNWNVIGVTTQGVSNAAIIFNGNPYQTDSSGNVSLTMPATEGEYSLSFDNSSDSYPYIVRTGGIPIEVYNSGDRPNSGSIEIGTKDSDRTVDLGGADAVSSIDVTGGGQCSIKTKSTGSGSGIIPNSLEATVRNSYNECKINFPAGTTVTGSSSWSGDIDLSMLQSSTVTLPDGNASMVVEIGSAGENLALSSYARITLPRQSGKKAGFLDASGIFHPITTRLLTDSIPTGFTGGDAFYDDGYNLIIYTKHFSKFIAYITSAPASNTGLDGAISGAASYLQNNDNSDWTVLALTCAGYPAPADYLSSVASSLEDNGGDFGGAASLAKTVIALRAAGASPCGFNGYNLVEKLYDYQSLENSSLNGPIFTLLALDSGKYSIPASALWDDQKLVSLILGCQNSDGSFALVSGSAGDPDITVMAITALAPHLAESGATDTVNAAVGFLSSNQTADGGFIPSGSSHEASETVSQAIIALSSVGIDAATDLRFVKNGKSLLDNLIGYENADGGFRHTLSNDDSDIIATQQALMALDAYRRFEQYQPRLFDLSATGYSITSANPQTSSEDITPVFITAAFMLVLIALATIKRRRRA